MDIMLKVGFPVILIIVGIILLLISKRNDSNRLAVAGMIVAGIGMVWIVFGTF